MRYGVWAWAIVAKETAKTQAPAPRQLHREEIMHRRSGERPLGLG